MKIIQIMSDAHKTAVIFKPTADGKAQVKYFPPGCGDEIFEKFSRISKTSRKRQE
ncbi:MAG: hypothetical protein JXR78_14420 [Victivallales bacterium]|nr:hypothetical protein [Victivallales bacterium]